MGTRDHQATHQKTTNHLERGGQTPPQPSTQDTHYTTPEGASLSPDYTTHTVQTPHPHCQSTTQHWPGLSGQTHLLPSALDTSAQLDSSLHTSNEPEVEPSHTSLLKC